MFGNKIVSPKWLFGLGFCLFVMTLLVASRPGQTTATATPLTLAFENFVAPGTLVAPVDITHAGDDRLFVVQQAGQIQIVTADGTVLNTPFLDISDRVYYEQTSFSEQGLLGLVFHPNYANNGYFYVNYTSEPDGLMTHIARFSVTADPNIADPNSEQILLAIEQPYPNHNAGDLAFGPDGYFYIPMGDGGDANDPQHFAQDPQSLLGKMLRLDVDNGSPYAIPPDNPFVNDPNVRDEIWAIGLRNPWRISFDRLTGDLYLGDVGQADWEEVDFHPAGTSAGQNYGWSCYEGNHLNPNSTQPNCGPAGDYTAPIFEYDHNSGDCAITGGFVYRGSRYLQMFGRYLFTDYCSGTFRDLVRDEQGQWQSNTYTNLQNFGYVTMGEGYDGELYVSEWGSGAIHHLTDASTPSDFSFLPVVTNGQ